MNAKFRATTESHGKREIAVVIGGKGGGRADMATGGGNEPEKLDSAIEASYDVIERLLKDQ